MGETSPEVNDPSDIVKALSEVYNMKPMAGW